MITREEHDRIVATGMHECASDCPPYMGRPSDEWFVERRSSATEPRTEAGQRMLTGLRGPDFGSTVDEILIDGIRRRLIEVEAEALAVVRQYVVSNRDEWSDDPTDRLAMAYADIYQKVLNVIDTGSPMGGDR